MNTKRVEIKNRRGLKVAIQVDSPAEPKDLVFIAHGQGGFMFQSHIQAFAEVFLAHNFRVVRFDATHSLGDSEGDIFDVTYDNYIEDLEDVIAWARAQVGLLSHSRSVARAWAPNLPPGTPSITLSKLSI